MAEFAIALDDKGIALVLFLHLQRTTPMLMTSLGTL
jgi:hypothetical protein